MSHTPVGTFLAATRLGSGAPLLLLHGIGSARSGWAAVVPHLAPDFHVMVLDLPGHGASRLPTDGPPSVR